MLIQICYSTCLAWATMSLLNTQCAFFEIVTNFVLNPSIASTVSCTSGGWSKLNLLGQRQNVRHFPDDIFKCIFFHTNVWISIKISLKFVSKVRINNIPALVKITTWRLPGDKPLSEPMMVSLLSHIWVTRSQCVSHHCAPPPLSPTTTPTPTPHPTPAPTTWDGTHLLDHRQARCWPQIQGYSKFPWRLIISYTFAWSDTNWSDTCLVKF